MVQCKQKIFHDTVCQLKLIINETGIGSDIYARSTMKSPSELSCSKKKNYFRVEFRLVYL